ncbi:hypothetical protein [Amycolatopsis panacis]|uniref:Translation initiation factor 2 n=1 Tax=Amycolatopsis panacis TaxID=2340917 RepID=A0A419I4W5_9PSEU|nr:hypothetical protein [Amycolatopsis panacis]RJQ85579.1 hypothetical protein D5S19_13580 [Amycolatopsis panacis]
MTAQDPVSVPIGPHAARWRTLPTRRSVVLVAHNITTLTRLLDIVPTFENDPRVQLVLTDAQADPFRDGLPAALAATGLVTIPWSQAKLTPFDLAISASHHGDLTDLPARRAILSHGIGYTKYPPRRPETGDRRPETGDRRPETGDRRPETEAFGLSVETLLSAGVPRADAFVLSHPDQQRLLAARAPSAAGAAVVAGDPCFDRLLASLPLRERYRRALGIGDRKLIVLSSTWSGDSLLGTRPELPRELVAELSPEEAVCALILHPNLTHGHGAGAVRGWYADCLRAGMLILDEIHGWRAGLIAADLVVGDHGSVTGYSAALGVPTLLGSFTEVPPETAISALGELAPRLPLHGPYLPVLTEAITDPPRFDLVADRTTSAPGQALSLLRKAFYRLLDLDEPTAEISAAPVPVVSSLPGSGGGTADFVSSEIDPAARIVRLSRRPAEVQRPPRGIHPESTATTHLGCSIDYPRTALRTGAAVLTAPYSDLGSDPDAWHESIFRQHPVCAVSVAWSEDSVTARARAGHEYLLTAPGIAPPLLGAVVHTWLSAGLPPEALAPEVTVDLGGRRYPVAIRVIRTQRRA